MPTPAEVLTLPDWVLSAMYHEWRTWNKYAVVHTKEWFLDELLSGQWIPESEPESQEGAEIRALLEAREGL